MEPEKKSNGALVGIVIVIIILVIGGIYVWLSSKNGAVDDNGFQPYDRNVQTEEPITATENDSTELDALQKEIDTTDTNIDANAINSVQ